MRERFRRASPIISRRLRGIENRLRWVLDIACRQDECHGRKDHAPHNFAIPRHIAPNLLRQERSAKLGVKNKRRRAGWDHDDLLKRLLQEDAFALSVGAFLIDCSPTVRYNAALVAEGRGGGWRSLAVANGRSGRSTRACSSAPRRSCRWHSHGRLGCPLCPLSRERRQLTD